MSKVYSRKDPDIDINIFKNGLINIDIFKTVLIDIDIDIFKNGLIDIDILRSDLIDIDIFKKCRYIDNRYGLSIYRTPLLVGCLKRWHQFKSCEADQ